LKHESIGSPYGIQGFPTIKVFGADKKKPTDYNGWVIIEFNAENQFYQRFTDPRWFLTNSLFTWCSK
jgi:hypothetical protein